MGKTFTHLPSHRKITKSFPGRETLTRRTIRDISRENGKSISGEKGLDREDQQLIFKPMLLVPQLLHSIQNKQYNWDVMCVCSDPVVSHTSLTIEQFYTVYRENKLALLRSPVRQQVSINHRQCGRDQVVRSLSGAKTAARGAVGSLWAAACHRHHDICGYPHRGPPHHHHICGYPHRGFTTTITRCPQSPVTPVSMLHRSSA